jgi:voltage-gated potassium channel
VNSDEQRLARWKQRMSPVMMVATLLPIAAGLTNRGQSGHAVWIDVTSWLVFLVDFIVHLRLRRGFLRTKAGIFDLVIVVLTVPWYLIPGLGAGRLLSLARLGRLLRVFVVSNHSKKMQELGERLGKAALYSGVLVLVCAIVVKAVEPESSGYASFGDAMWWAVVTFTTVGYGDLYPVTSGGRVAGIMLMLGGVALIGSLAASLGSFFNSGGTLAGDGEFDDEPDAEAGVQPGAELGADERSLLLAEVRALRAEVADIRARLGAATDPEG